MYKGIKTEKEAVDILRAYAACNLQCACGICPLYNEELPTERQRGKCAEAITAEKVRAAATFLRGL